MLIVIYEISNLMSQVSHAYYKVKPFAVNLRYITGKIT